MTELSVGTDAEVGAVLVGHGHTASGVLEAARGIVPAAALANIVAVDAGVGETPVLSRELFKVIARVDAGRGVLLIVDLLGASPCNCAQRQAAGHDLVVLSGLNLAMVLKLAGLDRRKLNATELAEACAASGRRSVSTIELHPCPPASAEEAAG